MRNSGWQETSSKYLLQFQGKHGQIVLDQLRTVDKVRLIRKLGRISSKNQQTVLGILGQMFAE